MLAGLRHQRARESGLIYKAYYDAFLSESPATPVTSYLACDHRGLR